MEDVVVVTLVTFIVTGILASAFLVGLACVLKGNRVDVESGRGRGKKTGGKR
jgi:hypothetical protein